MRWRDSVESFHCLHHTFIKAHAPVHSSRHDGFESDCRQVALTFNVATFLQLLQTIANRLRIIRYPFEAAFVQQSLAPVRKIEQPPLQRRRPKIGNEYFHTWEL